MTKENKDYFIFGLLCGAAHSINHALHFSGDGKGIIDKDLWDLHTHCHEILQKYMNKTTMAPTATDLDTKNKKA